jgi:hypothetical protein
MNAFVNKTATSKLGLPFGKSGSFVQAKLHVNQPGDMYEQEADAMADKVMRMSLNGNMHEPKQMTGLIGKSVQRKCSKCEEEEKKRPIMRKTDSGNGSIPVSSSFASSLNASKGGGSPLPQATKSFMENAFSTDFSNVKIHTDSQAAEMSKGISAKAFTYGNDIYFNSGEFASNTKEGKKLLAHELTHVVQQEKSQIIQRAVNPTSGDPQQTTLPGPPFTLKGYTFDPHNKVLNLPIISLPFFKERNSEKIKKPLYSTTSKSAITQQGSETANQTKDARRIKTRQVDNWKEGVLNAVRSRVHDLLHKSNRSIEGYYFLRSDKERNFRIIGTIEQVVSECLIPYWGRDGKIRKHQVDHIEELQLGGTDVLSNYELLDAEANMSSGRVIKEERKRRVDAAKKIFEKDIQDFPDTKDILANYITIFDNVNYSLKTKGEGQKYYWQLEEIKKGKHLSHLRPMTQEEIDELDGDENHISVVIGNSSAYKPKKIKNNFNGQVKNWIKGFDLLEVTDYNPKANPGENLAKLEGVLFQPQKKKNLVKISGISAPIKKIPGLYSFAILPSKISDYKLNQIECPLFSPINVADAFIEPSTQTVVLNGKIEPTLSFLKNTNIDILFEGDNVAINTTFFADDIQDNVPPLFKITSGQLTISLSLNDGLGIDGQIDFEIEKLGAGYVKGAAGKNKGFALEGGFDFDKGLFDESHIKVGYVKTVDKEEGEFSFEGYALKKSKNSKAIKSARLDVRYEDDILAAKGEAETALPGIKKGSIEVITGKGDTSVIADFVIGNTIPGVKGGNLHFLFTKDKDGDYIIEASSDIETNFPGIPRVSLSGIYNSNGIFLFEGEALLHLGKFDGLVHFGITNQEVDETGKLTEKPGKELIAFGKGDISFQMTDWLNGKIGATISPDARVILSGELRPDPLLPITKNAHEVHKKIPGFSLPKFTLFGIPRVAEIYVTASGSLFFDAGIGPLFLKNASLAFDQLDIEKPEDTNVKGKGTLDIPAHAQAGLEAEIRAGAGILVVDVSVGLNGSIAFAVTGNAGLDIAFQWSVNHGLKLKDSVAYLKAKAELVAKLGGDIKVTLDLLLGSINLYTRKFGLGEKRWPLGLDMDINFPLEFGTDNAGEFKLPDIDKVKRIETEIDHETIKKGAMEDPPTLTPAPSREKALNWLRGLPADATAGSNWITNMFERYNYVKNLKNKYPQMEWDYLDRETQVLDGRDFNSLKRDILETELPTGGFGKSVRLAAIDTFVEEHRYINFQEVEGLKKHVKEMDN